MRTEHFYTINTTGDLVFRTKSPTITTDSLPFGRTEEVGLCYDTDGGVLLKHGRVETVQHAAQRAAMALVNAGLTDTIVLLSLPAALLHCAPVRAAINTVIAGSGTMNRLPALLEEAIAQMPATDQAAVRALLDIPA